MSLTPYLAKYYTYELTKRHAANSLQKFTASLADEQIDLNPYQVDAALFAFQSPLSKKLSSNLIFSFDYWSYLISPLFENTFKVSK